MTRTIKERAGHVVLAIAIAGMVVTSAAIGHLAGKVFAAVVKLGHESGRMKDQQVCPSSSTAAQQEKK